MRIINKKYLLIILLIGIMLTGVIIYKPKDNIQLDNVILKQEVNKKTFAMYKEEGNDYVPIEGTEFPKMYVLNLTESKCIDNNGNKLENVLSYENGNVTITSGNTTYCYLYFDKGLGLEIKDKNPNGLSICEYDSENKYEQCGGMHRFQGQATDDIRNYICFGTSDKEKCVKDTDHYMYRIIGIEVETGRVKVIKKEALNETIQWWDNYDDDIEFPKSKIYEAINGDNFLKNTDYVPLNLKENINWEEKISNNTWTYGDMLSNDVLGARQTGESLFLIEVGKKGTIWDVKANGKDLGVQSYVADDGPYKGRTIYYIRHHNEKWNQTFDSKISLIYLHDYEYSISNTANCQLNEQNYEICKLGWIHLSQNDNVSSPNEWTMSRHGWNSLGGYFDGQYIGSTGFTHNGSLNSGIYIRPTFYINASEKLLSGTGTITDPFMIKQ